MEPETLERPNIGGCHGLFNPFPSNQRHRVSVDTSDLKREAPCPVAPRPPVAPPVFGAPLCVSKISYFWGNNYTIGKTLNFYEVMPFFLAGRFDLR